MGTGLPATRRHPAWSRRGESISTVYPRMGAEPAKGDKTRRDGDKERDTFPRVGRDSHGVPVRENRGRSLFWKTGQPERVNGESARSKEIVWGIMSFTWIRFCNGLFCPLIRQILITALAPHWKGKKNWWFISLSHKENDLASFYQNKKHWKTTIEDI